MTNNLLKDFYLNHHLRKEVFGFILEHASKLAAEYAFDGKDTSGFKQLKETLIDVEKALESEFKQERDLPKINPAK